MKNIMKILVIASLILRSVSLFPQVTVQRIDPPNWWTGLAETSLQLMVYGNEIALSNVLINYPGVIFKGVDRVSNPNYLLINLDIAREARPGIMNIVFEYQREILVEYDYELKDREEGSKERKGFGREDVIYLVMPDRYSNGDFTNDTVKEMLEPANRLDPDGRHGGDIQGIIDRLDYISGLGVTTLWLNPVQENNMPAYSYHGYAITDHYRIDPRFGDNELYRSLIDSCHQRGLKVIMDMVFNHCGDNHFWIKDMPMDDWVHRFPEFTKSNFRTETVMDPYASDSDRERMLTGWFDKHMPDLNQHNEILGTYLVQNSIWWIEYSGLDGIRMDTYPYSYRDFMASWMQRINKEYPEFSVVGETWLQKETQTAYWQAGSDISGAYKSYLPSVTDFPLQYAIKDAFTEKEGWTTGLARIYYVLSQDFIYPDPFRNVIFADNHDLSRIFTSLGEDLNKFRMAMAVLLTTRGIPMIYYGTELLMTGLEEEGHGYIREDFPLGTWLNDGAQQLSVDSRQSKVDSLMLDLNDGQKEALQFTRTLLNWRKQNDVVRIGKLKQFVPVDGIYVYFRYNDEGAVMVMINKNTEDRQVELSRFSEVLQDYSGARNAITRQIFRFDDSMYVPAETALIMELINL